MRGILQGLGLPECRIAMVSSMIKYGIVIYWSNEDEAFIAEVPELPGCAAHGATHSAALSNALDAIGLWMDTAKEFGDPIPEEREESKKLGLAELRKRIAIGSEQADRGEFVDGEETFADIRRRSAERKRSRPLSEHHSE